jgi:hypothetical protein
MGGSVRLQPARTGTASVVGAVTLDAALVLVFAIVGRRSHAEGLDLAGISGTAWPFLVGLGVGWLAARAWRHPLAPWPTGAVIWAATLVVGMLLRLVSGQGVQLAFVLVAAISLAILLLGWRGLAALIRRPTRARTRSVVP